jgi:hypothetical protein
MTFRLYDLPGCNAFNLSLHSLIEIIYVASPCNRLQVRRLYRDVTVMHNVYLRREVVVCVHSVEQMKPEPKVMFLTFILLMWRTGRAPNSTPVYSFIQQDATLHSLFISGNCSIRFGWYFHPSSGAHTV